MRRRWLWFLGALLVLVPVIWFAASRPPRDDKDTSLDGVVTAVIESAPFEAIVSATGNVRAERTQALAFQTVGTVSEVSVAEQDTVTEGQVLVRLDDADLQMNLAQANAALAVAQAQLERTRTGPSELDLEVSDAAVRVAQVAVQTAEAGVAGARASQQRVLAGATAEELAIAERRVEEAKNALWGTQAQRDAICGRVGVTATQADCDQANATVNRSEESVTIAELQLQQVRSGVSPADVASAQAQVDQALGQVASARAQLARAEAESQRARQGATAADIAVAQAQVAQAQVNVDIAASRLDDVVLRAPADGVVTSVSVHPGDTAVAGNPVVTLVDAQAYHVLLSIDEIEIGRIAPGQEARVMLDAYPGQAISGEVTSIGVVGTDVQGIVVYPVRVELGEADVTLRPFMTAAVDIVVLQTEDALLVPNRALGRDASGRYVEMVEDGTLRQVPVVIGASNFEYAVILEGLEEGDVVVVSRPRGNLFEFTLGG